jgi:hypothetical protein
MWMSDITMDLRVTGWGGVGWTDLAQDRLITWVFSLSHDTCIITVFPYSIIHILIRRNYST